MLLFMYMGRIMYSLLMQETMHSMKETTFKKQRKTAALMVFLL